MTYVFVDDKSSFKQWRQWAGYTIDDCVKVFQVNKRTVSNWEKGIIQPPRAVFICLQLFSGRLDFLGKHWSGFRLAQDGCITSPDGDHVWWYEIKSIQYLYISAKKDRAETLRILERQNNCSTVSAHTTRNVITFSSKSCSSKS